MCNQEEPADLGAELAADHDAAMPWRIGGSSTGQPQEPTTVTCSGGIQLPGLGGGVGG